ncbi:hypothetical protein Hanom_Chr11g01029331 [Helianthus anomalus]
MSWREMALKEKSSECTVIPEGALVLVGMSQVWKSSKLYPVLKSIQGGK